jgi:hypothetical protein
LRDNSNKTELYNFLADKIVKMFPNTSNTVIVTQEDGVVCNHSISLEGPTHCNHERADTQIFLHSKHTAADGNTIIMNKASDTDALVISVSALFILQDLWCRTTVGRIWSRTKKWILINDRSPSIGLAKSICLLFIHAFNGCDVVSAYHGKGEKTAWHTWNAWPEASTVFRKLSQYPQVLGKDDQSILEKFVVIMYDISSATKTGHMTHPPQPHPQHKQLSFYILSVMHTKQFAYGDKKLLYVKWKPKALSTGVGRSKMTCGNCF